MCNHVRIHGKSSQRTARQIEVVSATGEYNVIHVRQPDGRLGIFLVWSVELDGRNDKAQISYARSQLEDPLPPHTVYQVICHC
jgi:hypothetical protein